MEKFIAEKIAYNKSRILELLADNRRLEQQSQTSKNKKGMEKWVGFDFDSSSGLTPEFASFARQFKAHIKKVIKDGFELVGWSRGHFYVSGFVKNISTGKFAYFSSSDVRFSPDEWFNSLLVRTAKHEKDYTGGVNCYGSLRCFRESIEKLTA